LNKSSRQSVSAGAPTAITGSGHKLGSPEDMQTFASGEAKVCHQFENFKP
jgi:hypothetical protein